MIKADTDSGYPEDKLGTVRITVAIQYLKYKSCRIISLAFH